MPRDAALATLTAVAGMDSPAVGTSGTPEPSGAGQDAQLDLESARQTRVAADATAGIADVSSLVDSMPPLATFTPGGPGTESQDRMVYVRGGALRVSGAGGGESEKLSASSDLPEVWSPPEDPGRAWQSPDRLKVAYFAGADAELWVAQVDDGQAARVSPPNLPTDLHKVDVAGRQQEVRLRPGQDYTLVCLAGGTEPVAVFVDDNSRHVRGEARLRVIHAAGLYRDEVVDARVNGSSVGRTMPFGGSTGDGRIPSGQVQIALHDVDGALLATLPAFAAGDKELKTVFLYGSDKLQAMETSYEPSSPPSGNARVRVFNATDAPVELRIDGGTVLASDLAAGSVGDYVAVPSLLGLDERADARVTLYGLRSGEEPLTWSPSSSRIAFVGVGDGKTDMYVAQIGGAVERLTDDAVADRNPRWSPDGESLAWESIDESYDVHTIRVWRSGRVATLDLGAVNQAAGWPESTTLQFPGGFDWADDDQIYMFPKSSEGAAGLWVFGADGQGGRQLLSAAVKEPDFSRQIGAWALAPDDRPGELITLGLDGTETTLVTGDAHFPKWSPDGKLLSWVEGDSTSVSGWRLHVVQSDGKNDRVLTDWLPILQDQPPVPGPNAKRWWLDEGRKIAFTRAGRDYGAAERAGGYGSVQAGNDIENLWIVATDGKSPPVQATDLIQVFYLGRLAESPSGDAIGIVGFSYQDRAQQLWTIPAAGGQPTKIDGDARWFGWLP